MKTTNIFIAIALYALTSFPPFGGTKGGCQNISINTTGAVPTTASMLEVKQPSGTTNTFGIYVEHTGATAGNTYYALQAITNGAGLNKIAAYLSASGGTNNYALIIPSGGGSVGIGTTSPASLLDVRGGRIFVGTNTFAKAAGQTGDINLDNGTTDSPGIHFYTAANTNFGIDVLTDLRFVSNLDEGGGVVRMALTTGGTLQLNAYTTNGILRTTGGNGTLSSTGGGINLTSEVTGVLPIANGGTNRSTIGANGTMLYSDGTNYQVLASGTAGYQLQTNGAAAPTWVAAPAGNGTTDYLARWTSATNLGIGVTRDNNSTVGINVAPSASYNLYVSGALAVADNATIYGQSTGAARVYGVLGTASGNVVNTSGVKGIASGTTAATNGVWGTAASTSGTGVYGEATEATAFTTTGVLGIAARGAGVWGQATGSDGWGTAGIANVVNGVGVYGSANNTAGTGVWGTTNNASGYGLYGDASATTGIGIVGINSGAAGATVGHGVVGQTSKSQGFGIKGDNFNNVTPGTTGGTGVAGTGNNQTLSYLTAGQGGAFTGLRYGVFGKSTQAGATQNAAFYGSNGSSGVVSWLALYNGTMYKTVASGAATNSCAVPDLNNNMVCMHAPESP
jgi:hypothetical protein